MKQAQRNIWRGAHSNFKVEWLRDPDLKGYLQKNTENEDLIIVNAFQITVRNAKNSMLLRYNNSNKHKNS